MKWNRLKMFLLIATVSCLGACSNRAKCPAYMDVETISVAEAGTYNPAQAGYFQTSRSKKTGLITDGRKKKRTKKGIAKQRKTDKGFYKDPNLFHDKKNKRPRNLRGKKRFPWINFSRMIPKKRRKAESGGGGDNLAPEEAPGDQSEIIQPKEEDAPKEDTNEKQEGEE